MSHNQKWMEKYELLKEYQKEYGNIDVPQSYEKDGIKLGQWLAMQRQAYKGQGKCTITQNQIQLLEELGINWNLQDKRWNEYYQLLTEYQKEHGNIDVPQSYEQNGIKLGIWLHNQKQAYKGTGKGSITQDQIKLLEELGMHWNLHDSRWNDYYKQLQEYKKEYGNIDVPQSYEQNGIKLGQWLSTQRQAYKGKGNSRITQDQIKLLEELGMNWQVNDKQWNDYYELLKEYKKEYGNINVPYSYEKDGKKLGIWLSSQKQIYNGKTKGNLNETRIQLLEELGMSWDKTHRIWNDYYEELKEYKKQHGNIDVPISYEKDEIKLGIWLYNQRQAYKGNRRSRITQNQIKLLEELGINWQVNDKQWNDYYELLKEYKEEHGNIDVPQSYEQNGIKLGQWLSTQRRAYKGKGTNKITQDQIKLLEELGMHWNLRDSRWNDYYELLKEYQKEYGNIDVAVTYEKNGMKLGKWLSTQRQAYKGKGTSRITRDQIKLLEKLGMSWGKTHRMSWDKTHRIWNDYYKILKEYQEEHGNIDVPTYYQVNQIKLGVWLHHQRQAYKGQKPCVITKNQIRLLNELNIDWNLRDTKFLQKTINDQTQEKYQQVLLERVNHIIEDLVYEGINDINATNQKEIEKIMIKRIWR